MNAATKARKVPKSVWTSNNNQKQTLVDFEKGVDSLTAEIGPIFGRKLNVRFTFFVVYI